MALERWSLSLCAVLLAMAGLFALPAAAQPKEGEGWTLCNRTSYIIEAAIGRPEPGGITVEGWTKLAPGSCKLAYDGPLTPGTHFLFGRTSRAHLGGVRTWGGGQALCVDPTASFSLENPPDCAAMGLVSERFRPVEITGAASWTNNFSEIEEYDLTRARNAGLQRLLDEAGIHSATPDGMIGHRTRTAINDFLRLHNLPENTSDGDLIDYLEQAAEERRRNVGFTICNRTRARVWTAIARRTVDGWESRGWWRIEAGGCARVIDRPLRSSEHFVYAELEEPNRPVRTLARASEPFCIGRARFAIVGRDECEDSVYRTELFARTQPPVERKLLFELFERDFTAPANER